MRITCIKDGKTGVVCLQGELDHHSAEKTRNSIDSFLDCNEIDELVIDMAGVNFMDSSGLGVVLGRYKKMRENGGVLKIANSHGHAESILAMSGVFSIIEKAETFLEA